MAQVEINEEIKMRIKSFLLLCLSLTSLRAASEINLCPKLADALKAGYTDRALDEREPSACPTLSKVALWQGLRQGDDRLSFQDYKRFVAQKTRWPWLYEIRAKGEQFMEGSSLREMETYLGSKGPQTYSGAIIYIKALQGAGQKSKAHAMIQQVWRHLDLKLEKQTAFYKEFKGHLTNDDHHHRLTYLINERKFEKAESLLKLLSIRNLLYKTRIALLQKKEGAGTLYQNLSSHQKNTPVVLKDYFAWLLNKDLSGAEQFLKTHHTYIEGHPNLFGRLLMAMTRDYLNQKRYAKAQQVVHQIPHLSGEMEAERIFLIAWLDARQGQYSKSVEGLKKYYGNLKTAQSMTRFAYWVGDGYKHLGQGENANHWFSQAAHYPRAFYGQQALKALGRPEGVLDSFKHLNPSPQAVAEVSGHELVKAMGLMAELGLYQEVPSFYYALQSQLKGNALKEAFLAFVAKRASHAICEVGRLYSDGYSYRAFYPTTDVGSHGVKPELVHAIIRKESDFNPYALSPAGARGLMQVMPAVAQKICREQGIAYDEDRLMSDRTLNIRLGSRQLQKMYNYYDHNLILAIASYNAGSRPVDLWIKQNGDPRQNPQDSLIFIEEIPYKETRDYVRRVLENLEVYKHLLG